MELTLENIWHTPDRVSDADLKTAIVKCKSAISELDDRISAVNNIWTDELLVSPDPENHYSMTFERLMNLHNVKGVWEAIVRYLEGRLEHGQS